ERHAHHRASEIGDRAGRIHGSETKEKIFRGGDGFVGGGVEALKLSFDSARAELQDRGGEIDAEELGRLLLGAWLQIAAPGEAVDEAFARWPSAARALCAGCTRGLLDAERRQAGVRRVLRATHESAVDDGDDVGDRDARLGDVRRDDDLAARRW